jgi:hypothetical protein
MERDAIEPIHAHPTLSEALNNTAEDYVHTSSGLYRPKCLAIESAKTCQTHSVSLVLPLAERI